jgi:hypothetical protein
LNRYVSLLFCVAAALTLLASGCAGNGLPVPHASGEPQAVAAPLLHDAGDGQVFAEVSVLTYNINLFPWPLERDGMATIEAVARQLRDLRAQGRAPDILLIQEGFSGDASLLGSLGGYPFHARGPTRQDALAVAADARDRVLSKAAQWLKGETLGPVLDGGLHAFSMFPIVKSARAAFGRHACAGYDCLASKGALAFQLEIPGMPGTVEFFTTHLNSNTASGVPQQRSGAAYELQIDRLHDFIEAQMTPEFPAIYGGDFNIKGRRNRQQYAAQRLETFSTAHRYCADNLPQCDHRYLGDRGDGWLEPRDFQGFRDGTRVQVHPVAIEAMFDSPVEGRMLSDHVGYLVKYRLVWRTTDAQIQTAAGSAEP